MKIAIVNCIPEEYNISSNLCVQLLCKGMIENGHEVWLITPKSNQNHKYYCDDYVFEYEHLHHIRFGEFTPKSNNDDTFAQKNTNKIVSLLLNLYRKFDLFGQSITTLKYCDAIKKVLTDANLEFDVLISTSDPKTSHLFATKLYKSFCYKPYYIQYWGDPLTLDIARNTWTPKFIRKMIESHMISCCDKIAYVSPLTLKEQQGFLPAYAKKMIYSPTPCEEVLYKNSENNNRIVMGYFGSYNSSVRDIMPLYKAVKKNDNVFLYIVGDSDVVLSSEKNIEVIPRISASQLKDFYNKCNVIVDLTNNRGAQIPAKIFRDAGTNREVLLLCDGVAGQEVKDCFEHFNRYTFCENTEEQIAKTLDEYIKNGVPSREPLNAFLYNVVSEELLEPYELNGEKR